MSLTADLPAHDIGLQPGTSEIDVHRAATATRFDDPKHDVDSVHTHIDQLGRKHAITVLKRKHPSPAPYTCRIAWPWGATSDLHVHQSTAIAALTIALADINDQAVEDARATFDATVDNDHDGMS